jgi:hypothetical protein
LRGGLNRWIETGMLIALAEEYIKSMNRNWYFNSFSWRVYIYILNRWIETGMLIALTEEYIKSMNRNWYVNGFNWEVD